MSVAKIKARKERQKLRADIARLTDLLVEAVLEDAKSHGKTQQVQAAAAGVLANQELVSAMKYFMVDQILDLREDPGCKAEAELLVKLLGFSIDEPPAPSKVPATITPPFAPANGGRWEVAD